MTGTLDTDKLFTGQRLDDTGLYYYNARYYDATIGRFISADTIVPDSANPQSLNRYSYCLNNPLKYIDPSGHSFWSWVKKAVVAIAVAVVVVASAGTLAVAGATGAAYVIAEVVSRGINRRRGRPLQVIACVCFVLSCLVSNVWLSGSAITFFAYFDLIDIVIVAVGIRRCSALVVYPAAE